MNKWLNGVSRKPRWRMRPSTEACRYSASSLNLDFWGPLCPLLRTSSWHHPLNGQKGEEGGEKEHFIAWELEVRGRLQAARWPAGPREPQAEHLGPGTHNPVF